MVHGIVANSGRESPSVASNSEQCPLLVGKDHRTLKVKEIKIASLGNKFVGKISNNLDPLNVLKW